MWSPASAMFRIARVWAACPDANGHRADPALERGDALLQHVLGRVHDPRVDVAELGEPEQRRGVLGVAEDVGRRLVDRGGAGAGGRVGRGAGVDLLGLEGPVGGRVGLGHPGELLDTGVAACGCGHGTGSRPLWSGGCGARSTGAARARGTGAWVYRQGRQAALVIRMQSTCRRATRQVTPGTVASDPTGHNDPGGRDRRGSLRCGRARAAAAVGDQARRRRRAAAAPGGAHPPRGARTPAPSLVDELVALADDVPASRAALGLTERQDDEIERNAALRVAPTLPALRPLHRRALRRAGRRLAAPRATRPAPGPGSPSGRRCSGWCARTTRSRPTGCPPARSCPPATAVPRRRCRRLAAGAGPGAGRDRGRRAGRGPALGLLRRARPGPGRR